MDRGTWWAVVRGATKSQTRLKSLSSQVQLVSPTGHNPNEVTWAPAVWEWDLASNFWVYGLAVSLYPGFQGGMLGAKNAKSSFLALVNALLICILRVCICIHQKLYYCFML